MQDPGNLEGDLQAGTTAGYQLCWVLMWSTAMVRRCCALAPHPSCSGSHARLKPGSARYLLWPCGGSM